MATETDIRIARAVALKVAATLVAGNAILLADLESKAEELIPFLQRTNGVEGKPGIDVPRRPEYLPSGDPGPAAPYDDDTRDYDTAPQPPQGPVGQANPVCLCGADKPWSPQWKGWFCPNQQKSRDPAVQAQQRLEHPATWPDREN